jgi:hypothetical protein
MRFGYLLAMTALGISSFPRALESNPSEYTGEINHLPFYSQAAQDQFVCSLLYGILSKSDKGYYLEIGAGEPISINNSYFFEKNFQWDGISIDISEDLDNRWYIARNNLLLTEDATQSDYVNILKDFPPIIDYLSLDIDGYYDIVLKKIPFNNYTFKIVTIEHDFYRYGDLYRGKERQILKANGYYLLCSNVRHNGLAFEDWWIHPSAFPADVFSELTSLDLQEKECTQLIDAIQTLNFLQK